MSSGYGEGPHQPASGGAGKTVLIVVGAIGCLVLACGGVIAVCLVAITTMGSNASGTFTFVATRVSAGGSEARTDDVGEATADLAGKKFFEDIRAKRFDEAFRRTTRRYQTASSLDEFRRYLDRFPQLKGPLTIEKSTSSFVGTKGTYRLKLGDGKDELNVSLELANENGKWKIDRISTDADH